MTTTESPQQPSFAFPLDSEMWRINHQRCGLFYGPAAAILQIAHPRIAQGVADHSDFDSDSLGRLTRTLQGTNRIAFGTRAEAEAMQQKLQSIHSQVRGDTSAGMDGRPKYSAFEPDLLLWVLATMITAALEGYQLIGNQPSAERKQQFYTEMREFGSYFGLDAEYGPADYQAFEDYYHEMLNSDLLGSHPICAQLAQAIALPSDSLKARTIGRSIYSLTVETLPFPARERLGFKSSALTRSSMRLLKTAAPRVFPRLPQPLRNFPEAQERLAREK